MEYLSLDLSPIQSGEQILRSDRVQIVGGRAKQPVQKRHGGRLRREELAGTKMDRGIPSQEICGNMIDQWDLSLTKTPETQTPCMWAPSRHPQLFSTPLGGCDTFLELSHGHHVPSAEWNDRSSTRHWLELGSLMLHCSKHQSCKARATWTSLQILLGEYTARVSSLNANWIQQHRCCRNFSLFPKGRFQGRRQWHHL